MSRYWIVLLFLFNLTTKCSDFNDCMGSCYDSSSVHNPCLRAIAYAIAEAK